jgi:hypothetical protein
VSSRCARVHRSADGGSSSVEGYPEVGACAACDVAIRDRGGQRPRKAHHVRPNAQNVWSRLDFGTGGGESQSMFPGRAGGGAPGALAGASLCLILVSRLMPLALPTAQGYRPLTRDRRGQRSSYTRTHRTRSLCTLTSSSAAPHTLPTLKADSDTSTLRSAVPQNTSQLTVCTRGRGRVTGPRRLRARARGSACHQPNRAPPCGSRVPRRPCQTAC